MANVIITAMREDDDEDDDDDDDDINFSHFPAYSSSRAALPGAQITPVLHNNIEHQDQLNT